MFVWFQLGWAAGGDNEFSKFGHQIMWMFNLPTLPYILSVHFFHAENAKSVWRLTWFGLVTW